MQTRLLLILFLFVSEILSAKLPDLIPYRKGNFWGYCDSTKKIIIPCRFDEVKLFFGDSARGVLNSTNGYIMKNGDFHPNPPPIVMNYPWAISTVAFPGIYYLWFTEPVKCKGLSLVSDSVTSFYGFKNCNGKIVIPCIYPEAHDFYDGLAHVILDDNIQGYINEKGKFVLKYDRNVELFDFNKNAAIIGIDGKQGVINKKGNFIIPPLCDQIMDKQNFFLVENYNAGTHMVFSREGKWDDNRAFTQFDACENNYWLVCYNERFGFLNEFGKEVVEIKYLEVTPFAYGFASVSDSTGLFGIVNQTGKEVIPIKYYSAEPFYSGTIKVSDSTELFGLFNEIGKPLTPIKYSSIDFFNNGIAIVTDNSGLSGFIDEKGKEVIPLKYNEVYTFQNGLAAVKDSTENWGFIDIRGKTILPCKYWVPLNGGFDQNGMCEINKTGFIDIYGTEYWEE